MVPWLLCASNNHFPKCASPVGWGRTTPVPLGPGYISCFISPALPIPSHFFFEQNWTRFHFSHSAYALVLLETHICTSPSGHFVLTPLWSSFWNLPSQYLLVTYSTLSLVNFTHSFSKICVLWIVFIFTLCERFSTYVFTYYAKQNYKLCIGISVL